MAKYKVLKNCIRVSENNKPYGVGGILELKPTEVDKRVKGGYIDAKPLSGGTKPGTTKNKTKK